MPDRVQVTFSSIMLNKFLKIQTFYIYFSYAWIETFLLLSISQHHLVGKDSVSFLWADGISLPWSGFQRMSSYFKGL